LKFRFLGSTVVGIFLFLANSIVFAINNNIPFIALNYEHKIAGLLDLLNLSKFKVDIATIFSDKSQIAFALSQHAQLLSEFKDKEIAATDNAHKIAKECFNTLLEQFSIK
jgi:colanic acid/amylovoran biosynthesis protein